MTSHIYRSASLIAVSAALAANPALAANLNWNGTTVDWGDGTNWGGTAPTSIDNVRITEQGNDPVLDGTAGASGIVTVATLGKLNASATIFVGLNKHCSGRHHIRALLLRSRSVRS